MGTVPGFPPTQAQYDTLWRTLAAAVADLIDAGVRPKHWTVADEIAHQANRQT